MQKIYLIIFSLFLTWGLISPVAMAVGPAVNGLITIESAFSVDETVNRLQQAITERGANVGANIDHAANAQSIGQELRPTQLLIFGNPKLGTPLMQSSPTSGIDLPLKFLVWADENGQVFVSYNDSQYLVDRHKITDQDELIGTISNIMNTFAASVTAAADEVTPPAALPATGGANPQTPWSLIGVGGVLVGIGILFLRKNSSGWSRIFSILMIPLLAVALLTNITPIQADETNGLVTIDSPHNAEDTLSLLVNEIEGRGLNLVRTVDHQANAQSVGMSLGANTLLIFGNPNLGTGLIQNSQTVGIDLPQKILVWADENGQVKITYNSPQFIGQRHNLSGQDETLTRTANALNAIASTAAASRVHHVAASGSGTDCSASNPCGSIQQAVDLSSPGDLIRLRAGLYQENVTIPAGKDGLTLAGAGRENTILESAGGDANPIEAPPGVPADIILDIFSPNVRVKNITLRHPEGEPTKRDIGLFVRPPATDVALSNLTVERLRTGATLEPTAPGSRGVLVFRATGMAIKNNTFRGNYEDHIHLPTSETEVSNNEITGATRLGIVVIQETADSLSTDNIIRANTVTGSSSDGIQIQGDRNVVQANRVSNNGGFGIHLCGPDGNTACVPPGASAVASDNTVKANQLQDNALGDIIDNGENNTVQ